MPIDHDWLATAAGYSTRVLIREMGDIQNHHVLWLKFGLFLFLGSLAFGVALFLFPSWQLAVLMAVAIWAFCRAYYFAFYVIERYIDPTYRFAGLGSLVRYAMRNRKGPDSRA